MDLDSLSGPDGRTLYVGEERERGSEGPFLVVYADPDGERRWGFLCSNCETVDNAVESMGRIQCNVCANYHRAEEWDAAHE